MTEARPQRRLAAILAADVVGYSKLMGEDEEATLAAMRKLRMEVVEPLIEQHQGRLFKTMGDGFLAEFPSVVNAVTCAVGIQKGVWGISDRPEERTMELRIGINLGDVIIEGGDVFGDGVNVAARLESIASPGEIVVSASTYAQIGNRLDLAFEDMGEQRLKNIARPLQVYRLVNKAQSSPQAMKPERTKPSIAVLPFTNMSGDPAQQYISDGITEDIITELARFRGLSVVARHASFHHATSGKSYDDIARELDVSFVVEGSLRKLGNRIRITAQLVDVRTGTHIWADRYDRDAQDIFAIQDWVVAAIVSTLEGRMFAAEAAIARAKPTQSWSAYDYLLQARDLCNQHREPEAVVLLERATAIDPCFALAQAWLAIAVAISGAVLLNVDQIRRADQISLRALELDASDATCHWARALYLFYIGDIDRSRLHFERAMALNPADIQIRGDYANWLRASGNPAEALVTIESALASGPFVPNWFAVVRGLTLFDLSRYTEAVEALESVRAQSYGGFAFISATYLAAARAKSGDLAGASEVIAGILAVNPDFSLRKVDQLLHYARPEAQAHLIEALRKAGLPE